MVVKFVIRIITKLKWKGAHDRWDLFENLKIARDQDGHFEEHLNKYDVLFLDITTFISISENVSEIVNDIQSDVIAELKEAFPECIREDTKSLFRALV